jgi:hypothetical protein
VRSDIRGVEDLVTVKQDRVYVHSAEYERRRNGCCCDCCAPKVPLDSSAFRSRLEPSPRGAWGDSPLNSCTTEHAFLSRYHGVPFPSLSEDETCGMICMHISLFCTDQSTCIHKCTRTPPLAVHLPSSSNIEAATYALSSLVCSIETTWNPLGKDEPPW